MVLEVGKTYTWIMLAVFLTFSVSTFIKIRAYSDPITFYNSAIDHNPESDFAYIHRGYLYQTEGRDNKAINDFTRDIELKPDYAQAHNKLGLAYTVQGYADKASAAFTKAEKLGLIEAKNNVARYCK